MTNNCVTVAVAAPTRTVVPKAEKLNKFTGVNFSKNSNNEYFSCITTLGLQKFTSEESPVPSDDIPDRGTFVIIEAWK